MPRIMHDENQCEVICMTHGEWEKYKNVISAAENFMTVRQIKGYDDRAHKSAGWYLCEAVTYLKNT